MNKDPNPNFIGKEEGKGRNCIFPVYRFKEPPTLSEVVKVAGLGHNKRIRDGGFVVGLSCHEDPIPKKYIPVVKDPWFIVKSGLFVMTKKAQEQVIVVSGGMSTFAPWHRGYVKYDPLRIVADDTASAIDIAEECLFFSQCLHPGN